MAIRMGVVDRSKNNTWQKQACWSKIQDPIVKIQDPRDTVQDPISNIQHSISKRQGAIRNMEDPRDRAQDTKCKIQYSRSHNQNPISKRHEANPIPNIQYQRDPRFYTSYGYAYVAFGIPFGLVVVVAAVIVISRRPNVFKRAHHSRLNAATTYAREGPHSHTGPRWQDNAISTTPKISY